MSDTERTEFERLRSEDEKFNDEVNLYLEARDIIRLQAGRRMKQHFDTIGKQQDAVHMVRKYVSYRIMPRTWLSMAASIIVVSALAYFALSGIFNRKFDSHIALYNTYFANPGIEQVLTRSSEEDDQTILWNAALDKFHNSDYAGAVVNFRKLLESPGFGQKSGACLFAGVSYMNLNMPDSAVFFLNGVSPASSFIHDAEWYVALSHIKAGNTESSKEILNQIKQTKNHPLRKEASRLLRDLNRVKRK